VRLGSKKHRAWAAKPARIKVGDKVRVPGPCGLGLATFPVNGEQHQMLGDAGVFAADAVGKVLAVHDVVINYNTWTSDWVDAEGILAYTGQVYYRSCYVRGKDCVGWAGEGALSRAGKD
jgi:hypothetical protein